MNISKQEFNLKRYYINGDDDRRFDVYEIEYDTQLAANLVKARIDAGMTQQELASKINTKQPAIARAENGNTPPSHNLIKQIYRALGKRVLPPSYD